DHLAGAIERLLPARREQLELLAAPGEHRERRRRVETAPHAAALDHAMQIELLVDALELWRAERLRHEQSRHEPERRFADHDRSGLREALDPGRHVGGIA